MQSFIKSKNEGGRVETNAKNVVAICPFLHIEKKLKIFRKIKEKTLDFSREIDYYIQALFQSELL